MMEARVKNRSPLAATSLKLNADQPEPSVSRRGLKPDVKDDLKTLPLAEVEKKLGSSPNGLSQTEAAKRLSQYGPNEIVEKKTNELLKFLSYFWGPISTAGQRARMRPMTWRSTSATSVPSGVLPGRRMTATGLPVVAS